jgi:hypothetical protein
MSRRDDDEELAEISGREMGRTGMAARLMITDGPHAGHEKWVPLSLIRGEERGPADEHTYLIPEWFCKKEGLI